MLSETSRREQFSILRVISRAWSSFRAIALKALLISALFGMAPEVVVASLVPPGDLGSYGVFNIPLMLTSLFAQAGLMWAALRVQDGGLPSFSDTVAAGAKNFVGLFGVSLLAGLAILLGLVLLIIPGLYLMTVLSVAGPARIERQQKTASVFDESIQLTKGVRWRVFALLVIGLVVFLGALLVLGFGLAFVPEDLLWADRLIVTPATTAAFLLVSSFGTASLYHELRWGAGTSAGVMAEVFE